MKKTLLALAALAAVFAPSQATADALSIVRAFSINGRMHVWVEPWTNYTPDYKLQSRQSGTGAQWADTALSASNWQGAANRPFNDAVCLVTAANNCRGLMDFRIAPADGDDWTEFTVDCRNPLEGTKIYSHESGNPATQAFDADIGSYYLISTYDTRWIGLDFGKKRSVSRLSGIMNEGSITVEGGNEPDFSDARTLFTLSAVDCARTNFYEGTLDQPLSVRYVRLRDTGPGPWFSVWEAEFTEAIKITCDDAVDFLPTIAIDPWYSRENGAQLLRSRSEDSGFETVHTYASGESEWVDSTIVDRSGTYYYRVARIQAGGEPVAAGGDAVPYVFSSEVPVERAFAVNGRLYIFVENFDGDTTKYLYQRWNADSSQWEDYSVAAGNTDTSLAPLPFSSQACIRGTSAGLSGVNRFRIAFDGAAEWTEFTVDARLPLSGSPYHDGTHRAASGAFDGMIDSYYLSAGSAADLWVALDFGSPKTVATLAAIVNGATGAVFEGSNDRDFANATVLKTLSAADCSRDSFYSGAVDTPATVRYVRLRCANEDVWYSVWELEAGEDLSVVRDGEKLPKITIASSHTAESGATLYRSTSENSGYEAVHAFAQGETVWTDGACPALSTTYYYKVGENGIPVSVYLTFAPVVTRALGFNGRLNVWIDDYEDFNSANPQYVLQFRRGASDTWRNYTRLTNGSNNYSVGHPFPTSLMGLTQDFRGVVDFRLQYSNDTREWFYFQVDFGIPLAGTPETDYGDYNGAAAALDGMVDSYYLVSSYGDLTAMRTGIDFGEPKAILSVKWLPNGSHGTFEVSSDGVVYETIYTLGGDDNVATEAHELVLPAPVTASHFRYRAPADEGQWFSVWEIEADGSIAADNFDFETGCPTIIIAKHYAEEYGAAIFRAATPNGVYTKAGQTAAGEYFWTETGTRTGETFYYKVAALDANGEPGALSPDFAKATRIGRLERDSEDETKLRAGVSTIFSNGGGESAEDIASIDSVFDGNTATYPYFENCNPSIGLDFGTKPVHVQKLRLCCHDEPWYTYIWMRNLQVYGSNDEEDPFGNAEAISEMLPNDVTADGGFYREWKTIDCVSTNSYRYVFVKQGSDAFAGDPWRGCAAEIRLYGWRDVKAGLTVIVR